MPRGRAAAYQQQPSLNPQFLQIAALLPLTAPIGNPHTGQGIRRPFSSSRLEAITRSIGSSLWRPPGCHEGTWLMFEPRIALAAGRERRFTLKPAEQRSLKLLPETVDRGKAGLSQPAQLLVERS